MGKGERNDGNLLWSVIDVAFSFPNAQCEGAPETYSPERWRLCRSSWEQLRTRPPRPLALTCDRKWIWLHFSPSKTNILFVSYYTVHSHYYSGVLIKLKSYCKRNLGTLGRNCHWCDSLQVCKIFTAHNSSCGKAMFSQVSVILSGGRGCGAGCQVPYHTGPWSHVLSGVGYLWTHAPSKGVGHFWSHVPGW